MDKMDKATKAFFFFFGIILWSGIWLTGFDSVHWLLYLPATFFLVASLTGICPGMIFFKEIFRERQEQDSD